jgi:hypothetical protein
VITLGNGTFKKRVNKGISRELCGPLAVRS